MADDLIYYSDGNASPTSYFQVDSSGNVTATGGLIISGALGDSSATSSMSIAQDIARASGVRDLTFHTRAEWLEDFHFLPSTEAEGPVILNSGADAQAIDPALVAGAAGGVIRCTTGDADGTTANDGSQFVLNQPIQLDTAGGTTVVEARIRINTAVTDVSVFFGLTDATGLEEPFTNSADTITSTATDAAGFLYDTDATTDQWWGVAVDSDTDDTGNAALGTAPTADTWQILRMEISNDGATIAFYIDNAASAALTLSGAAGVGPDVALYPTVIACATTTTSKTVDVDWVRVETIR